MKLNLLLTFAFIFSLSGIAFENDCYNENGQIEIKNFNYLSEVDLDGDIQSFYLEDKNVTTYVFKMKNSSDILIAYDDNISSKLIPVVFANINSNKTIYKDINNRKDVLALNFNSSNSLIGYDFFKENDSNEGFALAAGCMGGSTIGCIEVAVSACMGDWVCAIACAAVFPQCVGAIAVSCAIHCAME